MDAEATVRAYYAALRAGDPLSPYFAARDDLVKVAISQRHVGYDAVADALREQTRTTRDWAVDSRDLRVVERGPVAWFDDSVTLAWTQENERRRFETRWSGVLETVGDDADDGASPWRFVGMHVSAPRDL